MIKYTPWCNAVCHSAGDCNCPTSDKTQRNAFRVFMEDVRKRLPSPPSPAPVTWEDARNAPSQQMYDQKDWDDYMQAYGQACSSGGSCTNNSGGSCGSSCEPKKRIEDLPCTCNDEQFKNHAATGQGYSDTCPYHTEWAKERRRVERGL